MGKLGIYVQVPFCQTKCTYCNFHTGVVAGARFAPYVEAVCREIREHERLLRAAGVDWAGRWGRGNACPSGRRAAPLQREVQPNKAIQREKKQHNDELKVGSCEGGRAEARPYRRPQGEPASEGSSYSRREEFVVDTVYIGGGTPSLLDAGHLRRILEEIGEKFGG